MNKGTKWLIGLVAVLVLANIGLLASIWLKKAEVPTMPPHPPRQDARDFLVRELSLDKTQVAVFDSLRLGHFERIKAHQQEMRKLKDSLFAQLYQPDSLLAKSYAGQIGVVQASLDLETLEHFAALRALLNKEQAIKFDSVIQNVLRTMGPRGEPPPRGDRPPPGSPSNKRPPED